MVNRAKLNLMIDIAMLAVFIVVGSTSILLFFGIKNHDMKYVHEYLGMIFVALMAIHTALHLNWLSAVIRKK